MGYILVLHRSEPSGINFNESAIADGRVKPRTQRSGVRGTASKNIPSPWNGRQRFDSVGGPLSPAPQALELLGCVPRTTACGLRAGLYSAVRCRGLIGSASSTCFFIKSVRYSSNPLWCLGLHRPRIYDDVCRPESQFPDLPSVQPLRLSVKLVRRQHERRRLQ